MQIRDGAFLRASRPWNSITGSPEIQKSEWRWHVDVRQERLDVLAHIVVVRAFPIPLGIPVIVGQRACCDLMQFFRVCDMPIIPCG
jgi:hypothetical protein